ncbi:CTU2B-like protein [Mya arenaria]|uniref:CTU2B-like protein n=1 Tax=Mya arenaria TaxID=6604 RepID=A0ABY7ERJ6_MYAAR|nr:CTU2B-like protein [Mya arenaria]
MCSIQDGDVPLEKPKCWPEVSEMQERTSCTDNTGQRCILQGLSQRAHKKLRQPSKCDKEDLESHVISKDNQPLRVDSGLGSQLRQLLDSVKSVSGKEDLIQTLRHQMLYEAARHCGYSKVMLGSCGTRLAVRLLTDISTGRGMHAAMECGNVGASIEHLTESFVTGLQAEYLSTVSNIMRTGEKLDSTPESSSENSCALCQGILDTDVGVSSALSALEFSRQISTGKNAIVKKGGNSCGKSDIKGDNSSSTVECCGEGDGSCQSPSCDQVTSRLCYGCRIVANEMEDINTFPDFVFDTVSRQARRKYFKKEEAFYAIVNRFMLQHLSIKVNMH